MAKTPGDHIDRDLKRLIEKDRIRRTRLITATAALVISLLMFFLVLSQLFKTLPSLKTDDQSINLQTERDRLNRQVSQLRTELDRLKGEVLTAKEAVAAPAGSPEQQNVRISSLELSFREQANSLSQLQEALSEDAERALSVPLLRKDLAYQAQQHERENSSLRSDIDRLESTVFALAITIITSLLTIVAASAAVIYKYILANAKKLE